MSALTIKIGVIMDPIESINYKKDTSLAMMWAAQDKGWQLHYMQQQDLYSRQGISYATMRPISVSKEPQSFYQLGDAENQELAWLDVILMRKDPPFDQEYIYTTYLLEEAERRGTLVVNRCQSLRDCNEKIFATQFPQCCPQVIVSRDNSRLKDFHKEQGDVIFKPLEGMGGAGIFRVKPDDPNVNVILEILTEFGNQTIMAQQFVPQISEGDKRILMINGEPVPYCLARIPSKGETRGNLAAGGTGRGQKLSDRDRWIAAQIGPTLREKGLLFVGLDVIGDYLTEINVTSPTCVRELNDSFDLDIAGDLMTCIAGELSSRS